jgi:hypothetical protein
MGTRQDIGRLPEPRGDLSELVLTALQQPPFELEPALPPHGDILAGDDDFHLALYALYELHYRGFEGVDERWEWDPSLLRLRGELERRFEDELRHAIHPEAPPAHEVPERLKAMIAGAGGPSLSRFLEMRASADQFREVLVHKSAYQLKEADPHSFAIPRLSGRPKVALVEVQFDEYGGGRPERQHARLFAGTMEALGLDGGYGAYLDAIPGYTLAAVNVMSLFGLHRRLRGAIVGHLAALEMDSTQPNRRYGNGLRRLGFGEEATDFFDEHVEADAVHEALAAYDLAGSLAEDDPSLVPDILFGARAMMLLDELATTRIADRFEAGESSLLRPLALPAGVS